MQYHLLVAVQRGGVGGVYRRERHIPHGVLPAVHHDGPLLPVDAAQEVAVLHLEIRVAVDDLTLELEHQDGDGLMHDGAAMEHTGAKIYDTLIPRNIRLAEAPSYGLPINLYDSKSAGAESYRLLAKEVIDRKDI